MQNLIFLRLVSKNTNKNESSIGILKDANKRKDSSLGKNKTKKSRKKSSKL